MAGPTTADAVDSTAQGERKKQRPGPPRPPRLTRPRLLLLLALVALLLVGFGIWALYGSDWLRAKRASVTGTRVLTEQQVREAARLPIGTPLISVDTDAIEARLRRKLPRIDSVDVGRAWPHSLTVRVTERVPVLLVRKGGRYTEVDAKGVRFADVDNPPDSIPVLELDRADRSATASLTRFPVSRLVREAVLVARRIPPAVARDTRLLKVSSYDSFSLELSRGRTVEWGSSEMGEAKGRTLTALMKAVPKAAHFDVSVPTAPASSRS